MSFSQTLLPEFEEEMKNTRKLLERVPDGKFDYQPHPKSMTMGRLVSHLAELPGWGVTVLETELLEMTPDMKPEILSTRAEVLRKFDKGVADARLKIQTACDDEWAKVWTFKYAGETFISMPRSAVMRSSIMNHMIHHRAQLGVFLRLNEVAIPGVYGPSADEMPMSQTQSAGR